MCEHCDDKYTIAACAARRLIRDGISQTFQAAMDILRANADWIQANVVTTASVTAIEKASASAPLAETSDHKPLENLERMPLVLVPGGTDTNGPSDRETEREKTGAAGESAAPTSQTGPERRKQ